MQYDNQYVFLHTMTTRIVKHFKFFKEGHDINLNADCYRSDSAFSRD